MDGGVWMEDGCDRGRVDEGLGLVVAAGTVMMGDGMSRQMSNLWGFLHHALTEIG